MKLPGTQIFVDLETTGINAAKDRICQVAIILPSGDKWDTLVNPEVPIPQEVIDVHGITNAMVKDAPRFTEIAPKIIEFMEASEQFVAYNYQFDFQFLQYELDRACSYKLREKDFVFVDPYKIFKKMFPHNLANAYAFYTGKEMVNAHNAIYDIQCTKDVFDKQEEMYPELFNLSPVEMEKEILGDTSILGKWFSVEEDGTYFKMGKHKGAKITSEHTQYLKWIYKLDDTTLSERNYIDDACAV